VSHAFFEICCNEGTPKTKPISVSFTVSISLSVTPDKAHQVRDKETSRDMTSLARLSISQRDEHNF